MKTLFLQQNFSVMFIKK